MKKYCYGICLLISITTNILLSIYIYAGIDPSRENKQDITYGSSLTWSEKAAAEAEAVAAVSCSGHGLAFLDSFIAKGQPVCECYDCYVGADCSELSPGCSANADSGDPIFLEPFWMQNAADSSVLISGWHRMSYRYVDYTLMSTELEYYIRKLHSIVGNAVTEGRYMVFGVGSSQLLTAALYALSSENSSSPSNVLATIPYYPMYKSQTVLFNSENFDFRGDTNSWQSNTSTNNMDVIEFVTSPNNPDGELKKPIIGGKTIYDHAYFWPHFTPIQGPSDRNLMIFTLSKLTGHAGVRFGSSNLMRERWDRLTSVLSKSTRFSVQQRHPLHCTFFNETRLPSPAYAWVKCEREEEDCSAVLEAGKIISRGGSVFSATNRYARLSLIKSQDDFELLMRRLTELVSLENVSIATM